MFLSWLRNDLRISTWRVESGSFYESLQQARYITIDLLFMQSTMQ